MREGFGPRRLGQLLLIAASELLEPFRSVVVPLAQLIGRRDLLAPFVQIRFFLGHPARPDPVHQHPGAVAAYPLVIYTAHLHCVGVSHWFASSLRQGISPLLWTSASMEFC